MAKYEYVAVEMPSVSPRGVRLDDAISAELNRVAAYGFRLSAVVPPGKFGGSHAVFEREVTVR